MSTRARSSTLGTTFFGIVGIVAVGVGASGYGADRARLDALPTRDHYAEGAGVFVGVLTHDARFVSVSHTLTRRNHTRTVLACSSVSSDLGLSFADGSTASVALGERALRLSSTVGEGYDVTAAISTAHDVSSIPDGACAAEADPVRHPSAAVRVAQVPAGSRFEIVGCGAGGQITPCGDPDLDLWTDGDARARVVDGYRSSLFGLSLVAPFCALFSLLDVWIKLRARRDAVHSPEGPGPAERRARISIACAALIGVGLVVVELWAAYVALR